MRHFFNCEVLVMLNPRFPLVRLVLMAAPLSLLWGADLPVREVILYKHGVAYFERGGEVKAGEAARLDFKASEMNDVLKSLTVTDSSGNKISGIRYDASEPLRKRLEDFPFGINQESPLSALLDQIKGARVELKYGPETITGTIMSARLDKSNTEKAPDRELLVLLTDSGDIRTVDLGAASSIRLPDPKLQAQLRDYLTLVSGARSNDRKSVVIESTSGAARQLSASYMTPAAVWKSSYRLLFGSQAQPLLEGWAIVDNTSGDDWSNVRLSVVSGRPISFITQLYEPRYVDRPRAELAESQAVAPVVFEGGITTGAIAPAPPPAVAKALRAAPRPAQAAENMMRSEVQAEPSTIAATAQGQDLGELFEYSFAGPVTVKKGESAMLPFLQQRLNARKLLIFQESFGLHPMNAAELSNSTGKTLDGGPITVYDADAYAGEALVETLKANDKRLISYGVDLGTRVSTAWDTSRNVVREVHARRGVVTARAAVEEVKTYTLKNVDAREKTVIIEHAQRPGYTLLSQKPSETTANAYRFEVKLAAAGSAAFPVREERVYDQTLSVTNITPDLVAVWLQNKALSDAAKRQLDQIQQKKREVADNDAALVQVRTDQQNLTQDQDRVRRNIDSLRSVAGQQDMVQQYARQLSANETQLAGLRDKESDLRKKKTALEGELNTLIERADF
jgi:hypothetical protein